MADKTIGNLTAASTPLSGDELLEVEQGGNSRKATISDLVAPLVGTTAGTVAAGDDSRFTDEREWSADTVGQSEAEAGSATTRRAWTAQRVRQAIVAGIGAALAGMGDTRGQILRRGASAWEVLSLGGTGTLLRSNGSDAAWASPTDANLLQTNVEDQTITGGAAVTSKSLGTISSGTLTLDMGDRPLQHYTRNGSHTLAPGSVTGSIILDITNGASAGAIITSGWTKVAGDPFTTTNGHKFRCYCSVGNGGSMLIVQAFQ